MSSDYLKKLIEQAEGGLLDWDQGMEELARDQDNAIVADSFDEMAWQMLTDSVPKIDQQRDRLVEELGEALGEALEDLFNLLHQGDPRFTDKDAMLPEFEINLIVLYELSETDEFKALYEETRFDEFATAFAMLTMEEFIRAAFEQVSEQREQMQQAQQAQDDAMEQLREAAQQAQDGGIDEAELQAMIDQAQAAQQGVDNARSQAQEAAKEAVEDLRQGAAEARHAIDEEKSVMRGFGVDEGQLQRMSFDERRKLAQRLSQTRLTDFAKLLGQWRPFADAERRRKVKHTPAEVFDYELGSDLTRLAATELTSLAVPELEDQFWVRWARHELMLKKVRGPENQGQGPIIVVCDESYSMNTPLDADGHTREAWSKAVALSLCDQARRGKRDFIYIGFSSLTQQWRLDFPGGVTEIDKVIEFVEHFFAGGTHYERPLSAAMEIVEEYDRLGKNKPDIVFITDDDCEVNNAFVDEWKAMKTRADVAVFGIQIGGSGYRNTMGSLSDRVITINQLNATPEGVRELFRGI